MSCCRSYPLTMHINPHPPCHPSPTTPFYILNDRRRRVCPLYDMFYLLDMLLDMIYLALPYIRSVLSRSRRLCSVLLSISDMISRLPSDTHSNFRSNNAHFHVLLNIHVTNFCNAPVQYLSFGTYIHTTISYTAIVNPDTLPTCLSRCCADPDHVAGRSARSLAASWSSSSLTVSLTLRSVTDARSFDARSCSSSMLASSAVRFMRASTSSCGMDTAVVLAIVSSMYDV